MFNQEKCNSLFHLTYSESFVFNFAYLGRTDGCKTKVSIQRRRCTNLFLPISRKKDNVHFIEKINKQKSR